MHEWMNDFINELNIERMHQLSHWVPLGPHGTQSDPMDYSSTWWLAGLLVFYFVWFCLLNVFAMASRSFLFCSCKCRYSLHLIVSFLLFVLFRFAIFLLLIVFKGQVIAGDRQPCPKFGSLGPLFECHLHVSGSVSGASRRNDSLCAQNQ